MTSIEWLEKEIKKSIIPAQRDYFKWAFEQAKLLHKKEIIDAHNKGFEKSAERWNGEYGIKDFKNLSDEIESDKYYQETFVSKGSDDHISDISKNVDVSKQILTKKQVIEILNDIDYHYDLKGDADWLMNEIINRLDNIKDTPELPKQETLYTEEQVREAIRMSRITNTINVIGSGVKLHTYSDNEIIESLKQPKKD